MLEAMSRVDVDVQFVAGPDGQRAYTDLSADYHRSLSAPLDDMWSAFADNAESLAIVRDDQVVGCASIDEARELHRFFVRREFDDLAEDCFEALVEQRGVLTVALSTTDPGLLSSALPRSRGISTVALVYQHETTPDGGSLSGLRNALEADLDSAVDFMISAAGAPEPWIRGYIAERIERGELVLHHEGSEIAGAGERRIDLRSPGHAHLGIVVGISHRNRGLGSLLMNTLVDECKRHALEPLCSTEPANLAAQKAIRRAGFRSRHRVFRISLTPLTEDP